MSNTASTITEALVNAGNPRSSVSFYASRINTAAQRIDAGEDVSRVLSEVGGAYVNQTSLDAVARALASTTTPTTTEAPAETSVPDDAVPFLTEQQVEAIVTAASEYADEDTVVGILTNAGLIEPEPEPEPADEAEDDDLGGMAKAIRALTETVQGLVDFAKSKGYRG